MTTEAFYTTPADAARHTEHAVRISLPALDTTPRALPVLGAPSATASAQDDLFRALYLRCGAAAPGTLAIASACGGEGKTSLALALATLIARDFPTRRVVYVEADFRNPTIATRLGVAPNPGLLESLVRDHAAGPEIYRETALPNMLVVPAGGPDLSPTRWYCSRDVGAHLEAIRAQHDVVVLDVPALLAGGGGPPALLGHADRVLFVVRAGKTPLPVVQQALTQVPAERLCGLVLNEARSAIPLWVQRLIGLA